MAGYSVHYKDRPLTRQEVIEQKGLNLLQSLRETPGVAQRIPAKGDMVVNVNRSVTRDRLINTRGR